VSFEPRILQGQGGDELKEEEALVDSIQIFPISLFLPSKVTTFSFYFNVNIIKFSLFRLRKIKLGFEKPVNRTYVFPEYGFSLII